MKKINLFLILFIFISSFLFANPFSGNISLVVIDAGHGGKDPGAISEEINEKDIVLSVSKYLYENLKSDYNCVLTRDNDIFLELQERCDIANSQAFDVNGYPIFISIHVNAATSESANGFELYIKDDEKKLSLLSKATSSTLISKYSSYNNIMVNQYINKVNEYLASTIESSIKRAFPLYKNRGIKEGNLYVLNQTFMPAVLIELGFITNSDDRSNLINPEWQKKMADAIASAIRSL